MPLNNKQPFKPSPNPTCSPTDEVFQLWPTGEIFSTYAAYIDALWEQRTPVWTCSVTAKGGLTFPEALASESAALSSLEDMPEPWKAMSARTIHHSLHALNHCATIVFERAKTGELLEGEEVSMMSNGEQVFGKILSITQSLDVGAEQVKLALYKDAECKMDDKIGEGTVIGMASLTRIGRVKTITKSLIKRYMRSIANRDNPFAPWVVERTVAERFGLPLEIPAELVQSKPSIGKSFKKRKSEHIGPQAEAVADLNYPIEDLLIPPEEMTTLEEGFIPVGQEYNLSQSEFLNALVVWSFLNSFARSLNLSPFSFDDWIAALTAHSPSHLLDEAFLSLFEPICKQRRSQSRSQFAAFLQQAGVAKHRYQDSKPRLVVQIVSSRKQSRWFEAGKSLGLISYCIGFLEDALNLVDEFHIELPGWSPLLDSLRQVKKSYLPNPCDLLFIFDLLVTLFADQCCQQLKEAVDAEIGRAEGLREKIKDIQMEEQAVADELKALESEALDNGPHHSLPPDSKERKKAEAALRKARQNAAILDKKRETAERDVRKASCAHRKERLGQDRHHRTYWWMDGWRATSSTSNACGKLLIETYEGDWSFIDCQEDLDRLISCLNDKGIRENRLKKSLMEHRDHMCTCFIPSTFKQKNEEGDQRRRGGVKKQEPSYLRYKNKLS